MCLALILSWSKVVATLGVSEADVRISIIAVHGLDGHWRKTWTADNGVFWLQDLLPEVVPGARVFSYGYDSRTHDSSPVADQFIYDHARSLVAELALEREETDVSGYVHRVPAALTPQSRLNVVR